MSKTLELLIIVIFCWPLIVPSVDGISESIVDLTHPLNNQTLHWVKDRDFELKVVKNETIGKGEHSYWYQSDEIYMSTHTGTHLDAPCHFARGKWSVADIPLKNMIDRPLAVINVVNRCAFTRDYEMSKNDLKEWEEINGKIPNGAVVLVKTGWARFWPKKSEYFGTDTTDVSLLHFPGTHPDAAQWLIENRQIVGIGIDTPSVDKGQSQNMMSHRIFSAQNIYILENIAQTIHYLPAIGARLTLLPLKIEGASGTPVTVIAKIDSMLLSSGKPKIDSLSALVISVLLSFATLRHIID